MNKAVNSCQAFPGKIRIEKLVPAPGPDLARGRHSQGSTLPATWGFQLLALQRNPCFLGVAGLWTKHRPPKSRGRTGTSRNMSGTRAGKFHSALESYKLQHRATRVQHALDMERGQRKGGHGSPCTSKGCQCSP